MSTDINVVPFKKHVHADAVVALKEVIGMLESGEIESTDVGVLVLMGAKGELNTFDFGPRNEALRVLGLLKLGEQVVIESALYPEP